MALTKKITTPQGFECPDAYIVVQNVDLHKESKSCAPVNIYKDRETKKQKLEPIEQIYVYFDYDIKSPIKPFKQAYIAAKKEARFLDCLDIFEPETEEPEVVEPAQGEASENL